jgi:hypothetical protein
MKGLLAFLVSLAGFYGMSNALADSIKGALDLCQVERGQYCYAWACAPEHPERLIPLRLSFDGVMVSSAVLANSEREEAVGKTCGGNKNRGVFFDFDGAIVAFLSDGNPHEVILEALHPETKKYWPLESKKIQVQGKPVEPVFFFQQPPFQGIVVNPSSISEINNLPKGVFGSANWHGTGAVVEFAEMTRLYLDSREFAPRYPNVTLFTSTPFYVFPEKINPWTLGQKLTVMVSLEVSHAERWGGGEIYLPMYTLWSDDEGHKFWLGWQLFDLRAMQEFVQWDDCPTCTGWPIVAGHANGGIYGHPAVDSARFMNFTEVYPVQFAIQVTWQNFVNAVNAVQKIPGVTGYPEEPSRYELELIWLNPEIFIGLPGAGGVLDIRFFGLSIGVQ